MVPAWYPPVPGRPVHQSESWDTIVPPDNRWAAQIDVGASHGPPVGVCSLPKHAQYQSVGQGTESPNCDFGNSEITDFGVAEIHWRVAHHVPVRFPPAETCSREAARAFRGAPRVLEDGDLNKRRGRPQQQVSPTQSIPPEDSTV